VTTHIWVLAGAMAVTALLNYWAVARDDYVLERVAKPTVLMLLIGLAWAMHGEGRVDGAPSLQPVLVALGLSLLGDIALLNATSVRFMLGLGAFLLAHVAWIVAILESGGAGGFPWLLLLVLPAMALMQARFGRFIVLHAGAQRVPVMLYLLTLVALVAVAAWRGDPIVVLGSFTFLVSDTLLGHDRFVLERRWAPLQVMVTYHLAQVLLVVGLLR
jgi:uncharacterized membrane protein YhhN